MNVREAVGMGGAPPKKGTMMRGISSWGRNVQGLAVAGFLLAACSGEPGQEGEANEDLGGAQEALNVTTDFKLGIQVADFGTAAPGDFAYTATYEGTSSSTTSPWACDADCFDPDSARLEAVGFTADDVAQKDFRVCIQASDNRTNHSNAGSMRCTPWASQGGRRHGHGD